MLAVMKFGGSSVADLGKIRNVAEMERWKSGDCGAFGYGKDHRRAYQPGAADYGYAVQKGDGYAVVYRRTGIGIPYGHDHASDGSTCHFFKCMAGGDAHDFCLSECKTEEN